MFHVDLIMISFFTEVTIVATPLPQIMDQQERMQILKDRDLILSKVKKFI